MNALKTSLVLALALVLAPVGPSRAETPPAAAADRLAPIGGLYYDILLGEIAGKRGQLDAALRAYLDAAQLADDARVAERAFGFALFAGRPGAAVGAAQRWLVLAPQEPQARQALVLALVDAGRIDEALPHLEAVREALAARDRQEGFAALAALLGQVPDKRAAYRAFAELRARHAGQAPAYYYEAGAALAAGERAVVMPLLETAIRVDPQWPPAYLLRARVQVESGELDAALQGLAVAVERFPDEGALRMTYARTLYMAGERDAALRELDRLVQADPLDVEPRLVLAAIAVEAGEFDRAVKTLEPALQGGERIDEVQFELGKAEEARGDLARAAEWYGRVRSDAREFGARVRIGGLRLRESGPAALRTYFAEQHREHPDETRQLFLAEAELLRKDERIEPAFDVLDGALRVLPDDPELLYARALLAERLDRLELAEADLRRALALDPDNAMVLNALGYTLADRLGRYEEARTLVERALARTPDDAATLDSMGWILFKLDRPDEALDYLRRARVRSDEPEIVAHLVEVLVRSGRVDEARTLYERALKAAPQDRYLQRLKETLGW